MNQENDWNLQHIKQCERYIGQSILSDTDTLSVFNADFGGLVHGTPSAVCIPETVIVLEKLMQYADTHRLPVTVRGHGLSQCGQSLAVSGGLLIHMEKMNHILSINNQSIWIEANANWASVLDVTLKEQYVPFVVPYNCQLSIGGVLSLGGIGASSFKSGSAIEHVDALEVLTADGARQQVDKHSSLFHAVLGGQGQFGIITKAALALRACAPQVRTFFLVYLDVKTWLQDLKKFQKCADYIESFCSPAIQGAKLSPKGRTSFAQWLFGLQVSVEYEGEAPELDGICSDSEHWKILHIQDERIGSYLLRHDARFNAMKMTGQWTLKHLWYECFVPMSVLIQHLDELLTSLPLHYATLLQIVPIAQHYETSGFFMLPDAEEIVAVMILNPGLPEPLVESCLEVMRGLDDRFLCQGGKRYLSGFLGFDLTKDYWKNHFNGKYADWLRLKEQYDPKRIFQSACNSPSCG